MSSGQRVVKTIAIILAVFISVNIISAILFGMSIFADIIYTKEAKTDSSEVTTQKIENLNENVRVKIDLELSNLIIKEAEEFKVEEVNMKSNLKCNVKGNTLELKEQDSNWLKKSKSTSSTVILYVPKDIILDYLEISMGVGKADIKNARTIELKVSAGAGKVTIDGVVAKKANIDGGAGSFTINNGVFQELDFDCGVGLTKFSGDIKEKAKISCGVGRTELKLLQKASNYTIHTETGLGAMNLNGNRCNDDAKYGKGDSLIKIEGGVGSVEITTK